MIQTKMLESGGARKKSKINTSCHLSTFRDCNVSSKVMLLWEDTDMCDVVHVYQQCHVLYVVVQFVIDVKLHIYFFSSVYGV